MLLAGGHPLRHGDFALLLHRRGEQAIGFATARAGTEEVSLLEEDRIDFLERDEFGDLEGAVVIGLQRLDLFVAEGHVFIFGEGIAADQFIGGDDFFVVRTPPLPVDAGSAALVQQIEVDVFRLGGGVEAHRDGDEAEGNRCIAKGSKSHESS